MAWALPLPRGIVPRFDQLRDARQRAEDGLAGPPFGKAGRLYCGGLLYPYRVYSARVHIGACEAGGSTFRCLRQQPSYRQRKRRRRVPC